MQQYEIQKLKKEKPFHKIEAGKSGRSGFSSLKYYYESGLQGIYQNRYR